MTFLPEKLDWRLTVHDGYYSSANTVKWKIGRNFLPRQKIVNSMISCNL